MIRQTIPAQVLSMLTRNLLRNRTNTLSAQERETLEAAISRSQTFPAGKVVVAQGKPVEPAPCW